MKEWTGALETSELYQAEHWITASDLLLFDIETTGFSPETTMLYMIGFCMFEQGQWHYHMLFNEDGRSEYQMLCTFLSLLRPTTVLVHYNGDGFDLPYLSKKIKQYQSLGLSFSDAEMLQTVTSVDLYKQLKPYRTGLAAENLKLPTIEAAMGIHRTDTLSGGDLIPIYKSYLNHPQASSETKLYQHNYEDILALIPMLQLLHFRGLSEHNYSISQIQTTEADIILSLDLEYSLPIPYTKTIQSVTFTGFHTEASVTIPLLQDTLKYFLPDWKNYYYLPAEDTVIHKSVAAYVDTAHKEKAKKQACYLKQSGCFLPCTSHTEELFSSYRVYRTSYQDSIPYLLLSDLPIDSTDFWMQYIAQLL